MMRVRNSIAVAAVVPAAIWLAAADGGARAGAGLLLPDEPRIVAAGREIYEAHCAACHGIDLEGQPDWRTPLASGRLPAPPHDATGHTWHHADLQLFMLTKHGVAALVGGGYESDMPAYDSVISDAEILSVLSYIKSSWPDEIRDRHDRINAAAAGR